MYSPSWASASVSVAEALFALTLVGINLSRIGEEFVLWTSGGFGFSRLGDGYANGPPMPPQKQNPHNPPPRPLSAPFPPRPESAAPPAITSATTRTTGNAELFDGLLGIRVFRSFPHNCDR